MIVRFGNDLKRGVTEIVAHVCAIFFNNTSPRVVEASEDFRQDTRFMMYRKSYLRDLVRV